MDLLYTGALKERDKELLVIIQGKRRGIVWQSVPITGANRNWFQLARPDLAKTRHARPEAYHQDDYFRRRLPERDISILVHLDRTP